MRQPIMGRYLVAIDGGYLSHVSDYYRFQHPVRARLDLLALRALIRSRTAALLGLPADQCQEERCCYYRGRLSDEALRDRDKLMEQRAFEQALARQKIVCTWVPIQQYGDRPREKGCDVALAVSVMDQVFMRNPAAVVLVAGDGDYQPLVAMLKSYHVKVIVLAWQLRYHAQEPGRSGLISVSCSRVLRAAATAVVDMEALMTAGLAAGDPQVQALFLSPRGSAGDRGGPLEGLAQSAQ